MSTVEHRSISDTFKAYYMRHPWIYTTLIVAAVFLILWASSLDSGSSRVAPVISTKQEQQRIFTFVRTTLDEAEESRVDDVAASLVERLDRWILSLSDRQPWRVDPFMTSFVDGNLPQPQQREIAGLVDFDKLEYDPTDGYFIQECMWLSQVSEMLRDQPLPSLASGNDPKLARVVQLFDWTVRNIALEPEGTSVPHFPWQVLLHGQGRVIDRAWVFSLLCRQAGFDIVMLGRVGSNTTPAAQPGAQVSLMTPWIPALAHEGKLYLFEHEYGVPIMKADGTIATLADVVEDASPLRSLDIPGRPYPIAANDLSNVVAMIEASPNFLTRRMFILENHLSGHLNFGHTLDSASLAASANSEGTDLIHLSFKPADLAQRLSSVANLQSVVPWGLPYERRMEQIQSFRVLPDDPPAVQDRKRRIIARAGIEMFPFHLPARHISQSDEAMVDVMMQEILNPKAELLNESEEDRQARLQAMRTKTETLWNVLLRGRLRYLEGIHSGDRSSSWFYQKSRPSASEMGEIEAETNAQIRELLKVIQNSAESDANRTAADRQRRFLEQMLPGKRESRERATYWLGLLHFEKQSYHEAAVYFGERFKNDPDFADSSLLPMARYNLGRSLEKLAEEKEQQLAQAAPDDQANIRQEVTDLQERALALYQNETEPMYVPQARARAAWYRQQLNASAGS